MLHETCLPTGKIRNWLALQKSHFNALVGEGSRFPQMLALSKTFAENTKSAKNSSCLRGKK